jgi:hypothetical protein
MWHSTHHVLSLAVLNHCPFNTETHNAEPSANPRSDQQSDQQIWEIANHHKMTWWLLCSICSRFKAPPNTTCGMSTIRLSTSRAAGCWLSDRWLSEEFEMTDWEIANHHKMTWWLLCSLCSRFKAPPNTTCGMSTSDCRLSDRAGVGSLSGLSAVGCQTRVRVSRPQSSQDDMMTALFSL